MSQRESNAELCKRIQAGDRSAETELLEQNDMLVFDFVSKIKQKGMLSHMFTFDDAVQEARLALLKAAKKFDTEKGSFSTYATWYMFAAMRKSFDRYATHLPDNHLTDHRLNRSKEKVAGFVMAVIDAESLDELAYTDFPEDQPDEIYYDEIVSDQTDFTEEFKQRELRKILEAKMSELTEREQKVLKLRFGWDSGEQMTLEQVAKEMGVTRERVRQVEARALRKLKVPTRSGALKDFRDDIR